MTWDDAYRRSVPPPWDIGRPQPELVRLAEAGSITGRIIDVGCGTGENALLLAAQGHEVVGIDIARPAVVEAARKARERRIRADFIIADALELGVLVETIGTFVSAIDSGMFHTLADEDRPRYAANLAAAVEPGGRLFLMCFSEREPDWGGPRRVSQHELRTQFTPASGWDVEEIRDARFVTTFDDVAARAWLATITRTPQPGRPSLPGPRAIRQAPPGRSDTGPG